MESMKSNPDAGIEEEISQAIRDIMENQDVEEMSKNIVAFVPRVGGQIAQALELSGEAKEAFLSVHEFDPGGLEQMVRDMHHGEFSLDTIRSYFLSVVIPGLINNACVAFFEQDAEGERHSILPFISSLHKYGSQSIGTVADPEYSLQATHALGQSAREIGEYVRSTWTVH